MSWAQVRALRERQLTGLATRVNNLSASIDQELLQWNMQPSARYLAADRVGMLLSEWQLGPLSSML